MRLLKAVLLAAPLLFALRLEKVWDGEEIHNKQGIAHNEFDSDFLGSVQAKYPFQENLSVVGRAGYKFKQEQPQYAFGVEYTFSYGGK